MRRIPFAILLLFILSSCSTQAPIPVSILPTPIPAYVPQPAPAPTTDELAIYTLVLTEKYKKEPYFVIQQQTSPGVSLDSIANAGLKSLGAETLSDFSIKNHQNHSLASVFDTSDSRFRITDQTIFFDTPTKENGINCGNMFTRCFNRPRFEATYPGVSCIIQLSAIGYDQTKSQALVSTGYACGQSGGIEYLIVLVNRFGSWHIKEQSEIRWII